MRRMIGLDDERERSAQSDRSSRGSHAPEGEAVAPSTGRRITGTVVQEHKSTEELDLMRDPLRELGHLRKLAKADPTKRFDKLHRLVCNRDILAIASERVSQNTTGTTAGIVGKTRKQITTDMLVTLND